MPREGTELAAQQKKFEEELASQESGTMEVDRPEVAELGGKETEGVADENPEDFGVRNGDCRVGKPR